MIIFRFQKNERKGGRKAKTFDYRGKNEVGKIITGTILAEDDFSVAASLREKGYFVLKIQERRDHTSWFLFNQVSTKDIAVFCRQFAAMFEAGITVVGILTALIEQNQASGLKPVLQNIYKGIEDGQDLSDCMSIEKTTFSPMFVSMVKVGELTGTLDMVMNHLADYYEREYELKQKIKTAFFYPCIVLFVAVLAILFVVHFVLPAFIDLYSDIPNLALPRPTIWLMNAARFSMSYSWILSFIIILSVYIILLIRQDSSLRSKMIHYLISIPLVGTLLKDIAIERLSRILCMMLKGGVPLITALDVATGTVQFTFNKPLRKTLRLVKSGQTLSDSLRQNRIFPPLFIYMIAAGEESGQLDKMLAKVAQFYQNDITSGLARLNVLIEPVLLGIVGFLLAVILLACIMPFFELITNINYLL